MLTNGQPQRNYAGGKSAATVHWLYLWGTIVFWRRKKAVATIGSLASHGQAIAVECRACGVTSRIAAKDTPFPDKMELQIAQRLLPCPNCGELNGDGPETVLLRPDVH